MSCNFFAFSISRSLLNSVWVQAMVYWIVSPLAGLTWANCLANQASSPLYPTSANGWLVVNNSFHILLGCILQVVVFVVCIIAETHISSLFGKTKSCSFQMLDCRGFVMLKKNTIESKSLFLFDCNLIIHINFILLRHRINLHELITKAYYNSMVTLLSNSNTFHTSANVHFLPRLQSISPIHWGNYRVWAERTAIANNHGWSLRINHRGRY